MKVIIEEKRENPLLQRTEVEGTITFEGVTPSNAEVTEALAKELKSDITSLVVKQISTKFGHQQAHFIAVSYANVEAKIATEKVTKHMRKKLEEERKKAEEKAEEEKKKKAEEKPKEEAKVEEKKE